MSFTALTTSQIQVGEPVAQELFQKTKDNFDDHETRISANEAAINVYRDDFFHVFGDSYWVHAPIDGVLTSRLNFAISVLSARLYVVDAGSSGTLLIDVEYKRGAGAWTSIYATQPSVAFGAGDLAVDSNGVLSNDVISNGLSLGDYLRLNIDTGQVGNKEFFVAFAYEKA